MGLTLLDSLDQNIEVLTLADTYWNPESDYDEGAAGMVGIVGIAALTLFTLAVAKGVAAGKKL